MDAPDVSPQELDHAMQHLQVINRLLNGYGPSLRGLQRLIGDRRTFHLLDVGCGTGDTLRAIATWAEKHGLAARLVGIELSERSAQRAAAACSGFSCIEIRHADLYSLHDQQFDIVHGALLLHHFDGVAAGETVGKMRALARVGVIVNDLHRHPFAYRSIQVLTRTLSRSKILQHDAPLSVARAFRRGELSHIAQQAGLFDVHVEWHWAFRWLMTGRSHG
jgi:SAM-dependent methyltransferase